MVSSITFGLDGGLLVINDHLPEAPGNHCHRSVLGLELYEYTLSSKTDNISSYLGRCHAALQLMINCFHLRVRERIYMVLY